MAIRFALSQRPFLFAASAIAAIAAAVGFGAARIVERRLEFHAQDGVLASEALTQNAARHYATPIHALIVAIVTVCAAIGRPAATVFAPIGYLLGASIGHIAWRVVRPNGSPRRSSARRFSARRLQQPISGALAAIPAALPLVLLKSIGHEATATVMGVISALATLVLTAVDDGVVRFMTESGYAAARIIRIHARPVFTFSVITVLASLVAVNTLAAIMVCAVVLAALILMTARILAYRVYPKRAADTLISICGIVVLAGIAVPMLLPVLVFAILWQLYRRAASVTWLLR